MDLSLFIRRDCICEASCVCGNKLTGLGYATITVFAFILIIVVLIAWFKEKKDNSRGSEHAEEDIDEREYEKEEEPPEELAI